MADYRDELPRLREENERLKALLDKHGIDWSSETPAVHPTEATGSVAMPPKTVASAFTTEEKVTLFRDLFQGRTEVYARRWESARGKAGYVPAFAGTCRANSVPCAIEVSRSGKGAHIWTFFDSPIPAIEARRLGAAMISQTCASRRQLELSSY
jgi:hypothetical protein